VTAVLKQLTGTMKLAVVLLYGAGLRLSTDFLSLAGGSRIGVPRNHGRPGPLVLLDSTGVERFGTIERASV
jgi:hypothetical protein